NFTGADVSPQGNVVITEIMYNPAVSNASYIEINNTTPNTSFDLGNWRFEGLDYTFPLGTILTGRGFMILAKNAAAFASAYGSSIPVFAQFPGNLDLGGKRIALVKPGPTPGQDIQVDAVRYENQAPWITHSANQNVALQVIDPAQDNSRPSNWGDGQGWRYAAQTGIIQGNTNAVNGGTNLLILLTTAGDVYLDDIKLVQGTVAEAGP